MPVFLIWAIIRLLITISSSQHSYYHAVSNMPFLDKIIENAVMRQYVKSSDFLCSLSIQFLIGCIWLTLQLPFRDGNNNFKSCLGGRVRSLKRFCSFRDGDVDLLVQWLSRGIYTEVLQVHWWNATLFFSLHADWVLSLLFQCLAETVTWMTASWWSWIQTAMRWLFTAEKLLEQLMGMVFCPWILLILNKGVCNLWVLFWAPDGTMARSVFSQPHL